MGKGPVSKKTSRYWGWANEDDGGREYRRGGLRMARTGRNSADNERRSPRGAPTPGSSGRGGATLIADVSDRGSFRTTARDSDEAREATDDGRSEAKM